MRGWLCVLSIAMVFPILVFMVIMTDGVIPVPAFSKEVTAEVVDTWYENSG